MIFLDTGALVARHLTKDQFHERSVELWSEIRRTNERMLTTNLVIAETLTMLGRRAGHHFAVERGRRFYQTESLTIVRPTAEMELAAIEQLDRYHDAECGFVDCLSFETMWHHKIDRIFTFDRHFALAGFTICP